MDGTLLGDQTTWGQDSVTRVFLSSEKKSGKTV